MEYTIQIKDKTVNKTFQTTVTICKDASLKRVILKAVAQLVEKLAADPLKFMREVNYLYRESIEVEEFIEQLRLDLDLEIIYEYLE